MNGNVTKKTESYVCSVDLQKALPFPILSVLDANYKRNIYCYNFSVRNLETEAGAFSFWSFFLPNDADFGSVEQGTKSKVVYLQNGWKNIMTTCQRKKKFIICEMNNDPLFGTNTLGNNISNQKKKLAKIQ